MDGDAIDLFVETFKGCGLKAEAIVPGYGLAEHTVYVCDGGTQRLCLDKRMLETRGVVVEVPSGGDDGSGGSNNLTRLVGCGRPHRHPKDQARLPAPQCARHPKPPSGQTVPSLSHFGYSCNVTDQG